MTTEINIREDGLLEVRWTGRKSRGSLFQLAADGNAQYANALGFEELLAVYYSVKASPFPLGGGERVYRLCLTAIRTEERFAASLQKLRDNGIGALRKALVLEAGGGFNAPYDSYLRIAYDIAVGNEDIHWY